MIIDETIAVIPDDAYRGFMIKTIVISNNGDTMKKLLITALSLLATLTLTVGCKQSTHDQPYTSHQAPSGIHGEAIIDYHTFEEILAYATDFVKAECIEKIESEDDVEYLFQIKNRYWGEDTGETFYLQIPDYSVSSIIVNDGISSYNQPNVAYENGKEYLLILTRWVLVFDGYDQYMVVGGDLHLPVSDLSQSTMYGTSLKDHIELKNYANNDKLINYVIEKLQARPASENVLYYGTLYVKAEDMETVITQSPIVVQVTIGEKIAEGIRQDREAFRCTVVSSIKGAVEIGKSIDIIFFFDTVEIGQQYIVAVNPSEPDSDEHYIVSSKNSVFGTDELDVITQYIP